MGRRVRRSPSANAAASATSGSSSASSASSASRRRGGSERRARARRRGGGRLGSGSRARRRASVAAASRCDACARARRARPRARARRGRSACESFELVLLVGSRCGRRGRAAAAGRRAHRSDRSAASARRASARVARERTVRRCRCRRFARWVGVDSGRGDTGCRDQPAMRPVSRASAGAAVQVDDCGRPAGGRPTRCARSRAAPAIGDRESPRSGDVRRAVRTSVSVGRARERGTARPCVAPRSWHSGGRWSLGCSLGRVRVFRSLRRRASAESEASTEPKPWPTKRPRWPPLRSSQWPPENPGGGSPRPRRARWTKWFAGIGRASLIVVAVAGSRDPASRTTRSRRAARSTSTTRVSVTRHEDVPRSQRRDDAVRARARARQPVELAAGEARPRHRPREAGPDITGGNTPAAKPTCKTSATCRSRRMRRASPRSRRSATTCRSFRVSTSSASAAYDTGAEREARSSQPCPRQGAAAVRQIVSADGHELKQPDDLSKIVKAHAVGSTV